MPEVKLIKPWRFYENGCRQIDFEAGVVQMSDEAVKIAQACGVLEKGQFEKPAKKSEKKSD